MSDENISLFDQLQEILLQEDRRKMEYLEEKVEDIADSVDDLRNQMDNIKEDVSDVKENIDDPDKLGQLIEPLVDLRMMEWKKNFADRFGYEIREMVRKEIKDSTSEIIEAIYPVMGDLIKRYVRYQFDGFLDKVNTQVENTFSLKSWRNRIKGWLSGLSNQEVLIQETLASEIEEVFIIHRDSGLLIGFYSNNNIADVDMMAGMLTAIKQFIAGAFNAEGNLESISHGKYTILVNDHFKYYVAAVISGKLNNTFREAFRQHVDSFSAKHMPKQIGEIDDLLFDNISKRLRKSFQNFNQGSASL